MASIIPPNLQNQISTGVSNAQAAPGAPTVLTLADLTPASASPQTVLDGTGTVPGAFQYPSDLPMYYMRFEIHQYSRANWLTVGTTQLLYTIVLPMPVQVFDVSTVDFKEEPLGAFGAIMDTFNPTNNPADAGTSAGGAGIAALNGAATAAQKSLNTPVGNPTSAMLAAMGVAINNYLTVMLKGPTYKQHRFTWRFSPRNATETETLSQISLLLREASAPGLTGSTGSAFFSYPYLIYPSFQYAGGGTSPGQHLYYFKPCFIRSIAHNYTPNGTAAFYAATQGPEGFELTLWLEEIEFWLRGSYSNARSTDGQNTLPDPGANIQIPAPLQKAIDSVQGKIQSLFPTNTPNNPGTP